MITTVCDEPTSLGGAIIAGQSLWRGSIEQLAKSWVKEKKRFVPAALTLSG